MKGSVAAGFWLAVAFGSSMLAVTTDWRVALWTIGGLSAFANARDAWRRGDAA